MTFHSEVWGPTVVGWILATLGATISYYWNKEFLPDPVERATTGKVLRWFYWATPVVGLLTYVFWQVFQFVPKIGIGVALAVAYFGASKICEYKIKRVRSALRV